MARKKVKLAFIENNSSRKMSYKKRVKGLLKKTQELSIMCDVDACAVVYSQDNNSPVVWPSTEDEAKRIIFEYQRRPEIYQSERKFDQHTFLEESVKKTEEKLMNVQRRNREIKIENIASDILSGKSTLKQVHPFDLEDLLWVLEDRIRIVQYRMTTIENSGNSSNNPPFMSSINFGGFTTNVGHLTPIWQMDDEVGSSQN